ncbi:MAG: response regulator transcription factor [Acidobacteria bacterium]|nr:response regulator transcription factor [Acidobacteriota bacterium]
MRILLVEDDGKLARLLRKGLEEERHAVTLASTGPQGLELSQTYTFDVIVLDVMLPVLNGFEVARRLRQEHVRTPILILTARDATGDVVRGLDAGADDYLTKPFAFDELLARLRALSRRGPVEPSSRLSVADLTLEPSTHRVFRGDKPVHLSRTEYVLLELLMRHKGRVLSRATIIEAVWSVGSTIENNTLEAFIRLLRRKVDDGRPARLIHTVRGFGYVLREDQSS